MLNRSKVSDLVERQKGSGLSIRGFCSNEGIAPSTFYYWKKKISQDQDGHRFIPLVVQSPGSVASTTTHRPGNNVVENTPLEIIYPNGTALRIRHTIDLAGLRSLVSLLD
jgi:hypothetical protein